MKYILSIIICLALFSCHDVKVGYLETEAAQYNPNVLEVTKSQDANDPLHVVSPPIEGVEGTQPIYITIRQVTTTDGDKVAFLKEVTVRGNGALIFLFTTTSQQELIKSAYRWKTRTTQTFSKTFLPSW